MSRINPSDEICDVDVPHTHLAMSGVISGAIAGLLMALAWVIHAHSLGLNSFHPFQLLFQGIFRLSADSPNMGFALLGFLLHLGFSVFLGALFSFLIRCHIPGDRSQMPGDRAMVSGAFYGAAVWAVMTYLVLPWLNPSFQGHFQSKEPSWFYFHLLFGSALLGTPAIRDWLWRRNQARSLATTRIRKAA